MELAFIIYLIDVLCGKGLSFLLALTSMLGLLWFTYVYLYIFVGDERESEEAKLTLERSKKGKKYIWIALLLLVFIPSEKTAYKMLAAYGVQSIVENPKVQELGSKSLQVLEKAMNEYIEKEKSDAKTPKVLDK